MQVISDKLSQKKTMLRSNVIPYQFHVLHSGREYYLEEVWVFTPWRSVSPSFWGHIDFQWLSGWLCGLNEFVCIVTIYSNTLAELRYTDTDTGRLSSEYSSPFPCASWPNLQFSKSCLCDCYITSKRCTWLLVIVKSP